ncbi:hypothetical protein ACFQ8C_30445 [Streptomyces sp. NPDC056503]|uniref:hypothetical protein n=1 Tax=Streptomyces sp. NPDC056503 TaxID=3345842 RepID=UPI00369C2403
MAGLVTVLAFAVATWIFGEVVGPLWVEHDDGARLALGVGAGAAAAGLTAVWGKSFATAGQEGGEGAGGGGGTGGGQHAHGQFGAGVVQIDGAKGDVTIVQQSDPAATTARRSRSAQGGEAASTSAGQSVGGEVSGPVVQATGLEGGLEIRQ